MERIDWLLFEPTFHVDLLEEAPVHEIAQYFWVVLIDVDNTLVAHNSDHVTKEKLHWVKQLKEKHLKVALMTNNYNGSHIDLIADEIDADYVFYGKWPALHLCYNPWIIADTLFRKPIREAINHFQIPERKLIVLNDSRIIVSAANQENVGSVGLVKPINPRAERSSAMIRAGRLIEKFIIEPRLEKLIPKPED